MGNGGIHQFNQSCLRVKECKSYLTILAVMYSPEGGAVFPKSSTDADMSKAARMDAIVI